MRTMNVALFAALLLVACGGTGTTEEVGPVAQDKYGVTYQPALSAEVAAATVTAHDTIKNTLAVTDQQMLDFLSNKMQVVTVEVTACPTQNSMTTCRPTTELCWADGTCARNDNLSEMNTVGTGAIVNAITYVYHLSTDPCVFDIEYGLSIGYYVEKMKLGVPFSLSGAFPEGNALYNALKTLQDSGVLCNRKE